MLGLERRASELAWVERMLVVERKREAAEQSPLEQLLRSIADKARGPCKPWSRLDKLICRNGCKRILLVDWDGRSIVLVLGRELGRRESRV
jgi:hypothetical protein